MLEAAERRLYPRVSPRGIDAKLMVELPDGTANFDGDVVDISFTGIKIKLKSPMTTDMEGKIKIQLYLPESGTPLSISGIIKHQFSPEELGLHYLDDPSVLAMDKFMFECFKLAK